MRATFCLALVSSLWPIASVAQSYDEWIATSFDLIDRDSLAEAEAALHNALRLEPANPRNGLLLANMGTLQRRQGKLREAEVSYTAALATMPRNAGVRRSRAALYADMEAWGKAADDYTALIALDAHDEEAYYGRAMARLMLGDTIGARLDLETIDHFNPRSAKARLGMAALYKAEGEYAMATELYDALIEANPRNHTLLMQRAEVHYLGGRMGAALTDIDASIALYNRDPLAYWLRARIRYAKRDHDYALRDINQAVSLGLAPEIAEDLIKKCK